MLRVPGAGVAGQANRAGIVESVRANCAAAGELRISHADGAAVAQCAGNGKRTAARGAKAVICPGVGIDRTGVGEIAREFDRGAVLHLEIARIAGEPGQRRVARRRPGVGDIGVWTGKVYLGTRSDAGNFATTELQ